MLKFNSSKIYEYEYIHVYAHIYILISLYIARAYMKSCAGIECKVHRTGSSTTREYRESQRASKKTQIQSCCLLTDISLPLITAM